MTLLDIVVLSMAFTAMGDEVFGKVQVILAEDDGTRVMTLQCRAPASRRIQPDAILIGEAIRQVRRMPEVLSGEVRLKFSRSLRPIGKAGRTGRADRVGSSGHVA
ncbi:MAG: hypothetical protein AAFM92_15110 [Pseudomonadota bacterium]